MLLCRDQRAKLVELAERDSESARVARHVWTTLRSGAEMRVTAPVYHEGHLEGAESWHVRARKARELPEDVCEGLMDPSRTQSHVALLDLFLLLWAEGARAHAATLLSRANEEQRAPTPVYEGGVYVGDSRTVVRLPRASEHPGLPWEHEASDVARALRDHVHFGRAAQLRELRGWRVEWARWWADAKAAEYVRRVEGETAALAACEGEWEWRREHVQEYLRASEVILSGWRAVAGALVP